MYIDLLLKIKPGIQAIYELSNSILLTLLGNLNNTLSKSKVTLIWRNKTQCRIKLLAASFPKQNFYNRFLRLIAK